MEDGRIPKDLMYGELATGYRDKGRPKLRYRDVCKRDIKALKWTTTNGESLGDSIWIGNKNCHPASKKGNSVSKSNTETRKVLVPF